MANWKDNADRVTRERNEKRERENQRKYQEKVDKNMWRCHICGKPSIGPGELGYEHFDAPNGLTSCFECWKWACNEHIRGGTCKSCWEGVLAVKSYYERATIKRWLFPGALFLFSFLLLLLGSYFFGVIAMLFAIGWAWRTQSK